MQILVKKKHLLHISSVTISESVHSSGHCGLSNGLNNVSTSDLVLYFLLINAC